ncbi:MAG: hypothetical protein H7X94_00550, partial [Vallitaleaceae bacterium]|nr:hypothetical protein [Vallitaleaceae bacterium]
IDYSKIKYDDQWAALEKLTNSPVTTHFLDYRLEKNFDSLTKQLMMGSISAQDMAATLNQLQEKINNEDR